MEAFKKKVIEWLNTNHTSITDRLEQLEKKTEAVNEALMNSLMKEKS